MTELCFLKKKVRTITMVHRQIVLEEMHQGEMVRSSRRGFSQQKMMHQLNLDKIHTCIHTVLYLYCIYSQKKNILLYFSYVFIGLKMYFAIC